MNMVRTLTVAALALLIVASPAAAKKDAGLQADHPLLARIASSSVERGREYRGLLVYPIVAEAPDPEDSKRPTTSIEAATAENLSVGEPEKGAGRGQVELFNWSTKSVLLLSGEILEGGIRDRFLIRDVLVPAGARSWAPVLPGDRRARTEEESSRILGIFGALAPDAMRLIGISEAPADASGKCLDDLFAVAREKGDRRSLPELFGAKATAERLAEYATLFETIPDEGQKRTVGVAAFVGERMVGIDLFPTNAAFRAHWPILRRTLALEASLYEAAYGLLKQPFPAARDPDRHATAVKGWLKKLFAARARPAEAVAAGEEIVLSREDLIGRCLTDEGRLVHAVFLLDFMAPDSAVPPPPGTTPGEFTSDELRRREERGTLTEYEKRLLERMRARGQTPVIEPPVVPGAGGKAPNEK